MPLHIRGDSLDPESFGLAQDSALSAVERAEPAKRVEGFPFDFVSGDMRFM